MIFSLLLTFLAIRFHFAFSEKMVLRLQHWSKKLRLRSKHSFPGVRTKCSTIFSLSEITAYYHSTNDYQRFRLRIFHPNLEAVLVLPTRQNCPKPPYKRAKQDGWHLADMQGMRKGGEEILVRSLFYYYQYIHLHVIFLNFGSCRKFLLSLLLFLPC